MHPPAKPIRVELNDALVGGIRQRGPDAFGLVIMAIAYLAIAVLALLVLMLIGSVFGIDRTVAAVSVMSMISGVASWLIGKSVRSLSLFSAPPEGEAGGPPATEATDERG